MGTKKNCLNDNGSFEHPKQVFKLMDKKIFPFMLFLKIVGFVYLHFGPSINGLVTDGNTKLCCRGFILVLF